jgi:hypothetical protein
LERFAGNHIFSIRQKQFVDNAMVTEDIRKRSETLRLRAEEVRVCAEAMSDSGCRSALEAMAASYEAMALSLENSIGANPDRWYGSA